MAALGKHFSLMIVRYRWAPFKSGRGPQMQGLEWPRRPWLEGQDISSCSSAACFSDSMKGVVSSRPNCCTVLSIELHSLLHLDRAKKAALVLPYSNTT